MRCAGRNTGRNNQVWCTTRSRIDFGECVEVVEGHRDSVYSIAKFFKGSRTIATGSADTTIKVWDADRVLTVCWPCAGRVLTVC